MFFEKRYPKWTDPNRIYNLKTQGSSLKGDIAEVIVKYKVNFGHRPREISPTFLDEKRDFVIPSKVKDYLKKYWYTIDLFAFKIEANEFKDLEIYEVKSRNMYDPSFKRFLKPPITDNALKAYKEAMQLGFIVKYAEVIFLDCWDYYIFFKDFNPDDFIVYNGGNIKFSKIKVR